MNNKELFKQAVADAKSIKDAALVQAKMSLEESLTPRLQSMLAKKLQEMENEDLDEEVTETTGELNEDDDDLDEILAELELEEGVEEEKPEEENHEEPQPEAGTEEPKADEEPKEEEHISDETQISSLTVADLKSILKDTMASEMGGHEGHEEFDLDDVDAEKGEEGDPAELDAPSEHAHKAPGFSSNGTKEDDEEVNLDELLAELEGLGEVATDAKKGANKKAFDEKGKEEEAKKELDEAIKVIKHLRSELNEVNLLNAKLLYVNKIFKAKNLTESQKVKIITTFDKATSVKETKLVYETLSASIDKGNAVKKPISESRGFASRPTGIAPKQPQPIVNNEMARWQLLAGIKKNK